MIIIKLFKIIQYVEDFYASNKIWPLSIRSYAFKYCIKYSCIKTF
jgi:hypothetical protein